MALFTRILVDIDSLAAAHPALEQAMTLAAACGARVTVVDVLPDVPRAAREFVTPAIEQELVEDRRTRLTGLAERLRSDVPVDTAVIRGRPGLAVIEHAIAGGYDLVVRSHVRDLAPEPRPFGAVDMQLLRHCPCPVWLVGPKPQARPRHLLAAVDAGGQDPAEQALNRAILELAAGMRDLEGGTLTVLHAWTAFGEELLRPRLSDDQFTEYESASRNAAAAALEALTGELAARLTGARTELVKGDPEVVIPEFAATHDVDLVVMGTVGRTGLTGLIVGNTAERILQRLRASVLAIKPPGFVSSFKPGA